MKKHISIILVALFITLVSVSPLTVNARKNSISASDISVKREFLIKDNDGLHSRYVVLATNDSAEDISVKADFFAIASDKTVIKAVHDCTDAVKSGQDFIIYGQFLNDKIEDAASFSYNISAQETSDCRYDAIDLDVEKSKNNTLAVKGLNYSKSNVNAVNVRSIFYKDGVPVAFESINVGDRGYVLSSGSEGIQELGQNYTDYDEYVITYSVATES